MPPFEPLALRRGEQKKVWKDGRGWRVGNILLTFHVIAFGLLIFSGWYTPHPLPRHEEEVEKADCQQVTGFAWDATLPNDPVSVDIYVDDVYVGRSVANEPREEMRRHGYGNGLHGFTFKLPAYVQDGKEHTLDAKVVGSNRQLHNMPETVTCPTP